jgi:hypothetical protein
MTIPSYNRYGRGHQLASWQSVRQPEEREREVGGNFHLSRI